MPWHDPTQLYNDNCRATPWRGQNVFISLNYLQKQPVYYRVTMKEH